MGKPLDEDDGRTLADMSELSVRTPFGFFSPGGKSRRSESGSDAGSNLSKEGRRGAIWGALSAALLIALAFIVGFGLFIGLLCWIFA